MNRWNKENRWTKHLLLILSAPSGAGKTTLCGALLKAFSDDLVLSISTTTRAPRGKEKDGREYFFVSESEFKNRIEEGEFAEWAAVHGALYGTSKKTISDVFSKDRHVLLDIDVQGAASLRKAYPNQTLSIFVAPPSLPVLEQRLRQRETDSAETIARRLRSAELEMRRASEFDFTFVNDDLKTAQAKLVELVRVELDKVRNKAKK